MRKCYARIDAVNPKINAVVAQCRERALAEAAEADALLAAGKPKGPLHGVPFTVKDSFDTAGVVSTGGTLGRKDFVPGNDATVVARARAAGAILLGKTNTPEFTLGGGGNGTVNLVYGLTNNPYDAELLNRAARRAAPARSLRPAGAFFDIGSDYGGSIRGPAYVERHRRHQADATVACRAPATSSATAAPFDNFQETGPMARRVEDLTLLMPISSGPDDWDAAMAPVPLGDPAAVDLQDAARRFLHDERRRRSDAGDAGDGHANASATSSKLGCKVTEDRPPKMNELAEARQTFNGADGREHMRRMLKKHGTTQASPGLRLDGDVVPSADFTRLCEEMDAIKSEQLAWFEKYDLIVCPAKRAAAAVRLDYERPPDRPAGASYTSQYNTTGWPAGVVRCGTSTEAAGTAARHSGRRTTLARRRRARRDGAHRAADRRLADAAPI